MTATAEFVQPAAIVGDTDPDTARRLQVAQRHQPVHPPSLIDVLIDTVRRSAP
jgi:hypothetical protein